MNDICFSYKVTRQDLDNYIKNYFGKFLHYNAIILSCLVIGCFSLALKLLLEKSTFLLIVSIITISYSLYLWVRTYIYPLIRFKEDQIKTGVFHFSPEGIIIEIDETNMKIGWELLKEVVILEKQYVFSIKKSNRPWFIPNHILIDKIVEFEKLLFEQKNKGVSFKIHDK